MGNIFDSSDKHCNFSWDKLGDIKEGRENLGEEMPVLVYRLMQYSINDILVHEFGQETANELFRKSGYLAGKEFAKNVLPLSAPRSEFVATLQAALKQQKIGILRIEDIDDNSEHFTLTVAEDLDCSGLPPTNEVICTYDEGFLAGVMDTYTGKTYQVREIDCWSSGARVCRFSGKAEA